MPIEQKARVRVKTLGKTEEERVEVEGFLAPIPNLAVIIDAYDNVHAGEPLSSTILLKITCDNESCNKGAFNPGSGKSLPRVLEFAVDDPSQIPPEANEVIVIQGITDEKHVFCSAECAKAYICKQYNQPNIILVPSLSNIRS